MNMPCHDPIWVMVIGIAHELGFKLVPEDMFIRYIPLSLICPGSAPGNTKQVVRKRTPKSIFITYTSPLHSLQ